MKFALISLAALALTTTEATKITNHHRHSAIGLRKEFAQLAAKEEPAKPPKPSFPMEKEEFQQWEAYWKGQVDAARLDEQERCTE